MAITPVSWLQARYEKVFPKAWQKSFEGTPVAKAQPSNSDSDFRNPHLEETFHCASNKGAVLDTKSNHTDKPSAIPVDRRNRNSEWPIPADVLKLLIEQVKYGKHDKT